MCTLLDKKSQREFMSAKKVQIKVARYSHVIILWLGLYSLIHLSNAVACSCIFLTRHEQFQNAEHVFIGRITGVRETKHRASHPQWRGMLGAFQVLHNFGEFRNEVQF